MTAEDLGPTTDGWRVLPPPKERTFADSYRDCMVALNGSCPIETGFIGKLADNECAHHRLPGDRTSPCGCWPNYETQEIAVTETDAPTDAPYGLKDDGTPRKRPAPTWQNDPAKRAAALAKRTAKKNGTPAPAITQGEADLLTRIAGESAARLADADAKIAAAQEAIAAAEEAFREALHERDALVAFRAAIT